MFHQALRASAGSVIVGLVHQQHHRTPACAESAFSPSSSSIAAGVGGIAVVGTGIWTIAERNRELNKVAVVILSPQGATATTFTTRKRDNRIRVASTGPTVPFDAVVKHTADGMLGSVLASLKASGGPRPRRTVVAVSSDLLAAADGNELGKLAGLVEKKGGEFASGELHGLSSTHEAAYTFSSVQHLARERRLGCAQGSAGEETHNTKTQVGVVATTGGGKELVIVGSAGVGGDAAAPISVACDVPGKGFELMVKQGGVMGSSMFEWHVRRVAANATRRGGAQYLSGHYALAGSAATKLLRGSVSGEEEPLSAVTNQGGGQWADVALSKEAVLQRLEGEAAALQQWLRLFEEAGNEDEKAECRELDSSSIAAKRALLAHAVALRALVDIAFDKKTTFTVMVESGNGAALSSGKAGNSASAALVAMGLYLEERSK
mmetsp:Transcript_35423/g.72198  ORF Transcript_35423/g.72198 Transcript_35423/m.72198 type:complete len:435 (-) Transcript_35423:190-1494(-)